MLNFHAERAAMEERGNPADNINWTQRTKNEQVQS
jgi:hypothetical protein